MPSATLVAQKARQKTRPIHEPAVEFARQSERLGLYTHKQEDDQTGSTHAVEARFVTGRDPVIETANGGRLPAVPVDEAVKLNRLRDHLDKHGAPKANRINDCTQKNGTKNGTNHGKQPSGSASESLHSKQSSEPDAPLRQAVPVSKTHPLFPPLPMYGPPSLMRDIQCLGFRISSAILSFCFLYVIFLGAIFTSTPLLVKSVWRRMTFRDPNMYRPFYHEEKKRKQARKEAERSWKQRLHKGKAQDERNPDREDLPGQNSEYMPTEGGPDTFPCDVGYYARRVGLDCETFQVQTEDGFILELWHLYNPREYRPADSPTRAPNCPDLFRSEGPDGSQFPFGKRRYPILMIHGLLQSAGAYTCNDEESLAFYLAKSGYDVWLGNNRCGFTPRHSLLSYGDPRMWAWNIRQFGVMDLPALVSRVLHETGFPKLGLVAHSQGTTETFVALAKDQRPELGDKISVFCALAPAVYAGPLIGKIYFKFMQVISPAMFRIIFGIHSFIPLMMFMHSILPGRVYGALGYRIFSFMFDWSDDRWEKDLRARMFQWSPVYVSSESMRWWLGRECFSRQKCILATREEKEAEEKEDMQAENEALRTYYNHDSAFKRHGKEQSNRGGKDSESVRPTSRRAHPSRNYSTFSPAPGHSPSPSPTRNSASERSRYAWYGPSAPPFAFWVAGNDDLVDGRRLLRRFERGREPYVDVVHSKIIEGYEHLDVIWAMDMLDKVGREVKEVIWRTAPSECREACRVPNGCERVDFWVGREERRESGGEANEGGEMNGRVAGVDVAVTTGEWADEMKRASEERKTTA
ncbi:Alpha/Beta hydrolase protein [Phyllosticta citriasiana]|uniref:Alpha/Beta hydrolase protein n=1 Tax=Phyllosticta citriasiana TaxID=595635 RepID=A0ABR1KU88_9PEZI